MWRCAGRSCDLTRLLRIIRSAASALCLLLFLAILLFWLITGPTPRVIWWNHSDSLPHYHLTGILRPATISPSPPIAGQNPLQPCYANNLLSRLDPIPTEKQFHLLGLTHVRASSPYAQWQTLSIPLWLLLPLLLILPANSLFKFLRFLRRRKLILCRS